VAPNLPPLFADRMRLQQILLNLLSEPRRVCRRLHSVRRWSHDEEDIKSIFS
jgi:signal transduction histidine kinase